MKSIKEETEQTNASA